MTVSITFQRARKTITSFVGALTVAVATDVCFAFIMDTLIK